MEQLQLYARALGIELNNQQLRQFQRYADELLRWNAQLNLTSITEVDGIIVRHFLDSLRAALSWSQPPSRLIDVGTGAGFPGVPLKILHPNLELTLVESIEKKGAFLHHIAAELGLSDVHIVIARAESIGHDPLHREQYDGVIARAVSEMRVLVEYCLPLCTIGGRFLAPKGSQGAEEAAAAQGAIGKLGGRLVAVEPVDLPGVDARTLVVVDKVSSTPPQYPRSIGIPAKRPL